MGLIILIVVGALLGWIGSILLRREDRRAILSLAGAGVIGALVAAAVIGKANLLAGIAALDLLWAVIGAVVAIAATDAVRSRAFR